MIRFLKFFQRIFNSLLKQVPAAETENAKETQDCYKLKFKISRDLNCDRFLMLKAYFPLKIHPEAAQCNFQKQSFVYC